MKTINRECPICGLAYQADPVRLGYGRETTCSRDCSYRLRAIERTTLQTYACATCGKLTEKSSSQLRGKHGSVFCSRPCHYKGRSLGLSKRTVIKPYVYSPEGKAAMIASSSTPKGQRAFHPLTCTNCGTVFDDPSDGRTRRSKMTFCSLACCNTYRTGDKNPAWRGGHPKYYGPSWRAAQRMARQRDGGCKRCGIVQARALDVHHIKPVGTFANPDDAHYPENLVSLCHPCHMWVEWHGIDF